MKQFELRGHICPKCGRTDIVPPLLKGHCRTGPISSPFSHRYTVDGYIERTCPGCHYRFKELPLDSETTKVTSD